jgi:hypothetical protein
MPIGQNCCPVSTSGFQNLQIFGLWPFQSGYGPGRSTLLLGMSRIVLIF